jgi:LysM repeat protein
MRRLKSGRLAVGQILLIPSPAVASASLAVPDPAIENFPNSTARLKVHTVRRGETMRAIARRYDTTPERLMRINGLRKPMVFPGQTLLLTGNVSRSSRAVRARAAAIRAQNAEREASRTARAAGSDKIALSSKGMVKESSVKGGGGSTPSKRGTSKRSEGASRSKASASKKPGTKKRSGADSKADARTKIKSAKTTARAS